jgi:GT2 family glycosyltransferase
VRGELRRFSTPPIPKPVTFVEYSREQAEQGGVIGAIEPRLILIQTGGNLGFAGGNNVGLRYALARGAFSYVWILNNDTVVAQESLTELVRRANQLNSAGIVGSTLVYYRLPDRIQAYCGGAYNKLSGSTRYLGNGLSARDLNTDPTNVEQNIDYVSGASMLVSAEFLRVIGLMEEEYFLYFEELDWAVRSGGQFLMGYAPKSIVYHKEGAAIGTNSTDPAQKSALADYFDI